MIIIVHQNVVEVVVDQKKYLVVIKIEDDQDQGTKEIFSKPKFNQHSFSFLRSGHRSSKHSRSYRSSRSRSRDRHRHKRSRSR